MKFLLNLHDKLRPQFQKGGKFEKLWPLFDAQDTFMFTPPDTTSTGAHVRDALDLKRVMITVVVALLPCVLFGIWNAGHQMNIAAGGAARSVMADFAAGLPHVLLLILVSYVFGGIWEVIFAIVRKHEINEGFLVTGLLFPLTLPPTLPWWQAALGISFGVVVGKEVFGGTGMNILNPALTARAFVFFAYPGFMSGDSVWTAIKGGAGKAVDGFSGATALSVCATAEGPASMVDTLAKAGFTFKSMFLGLEGGSIGETSALACVIGAAILLLTGIGSWRIMLFTVLGCLGGGAIANAIGHSPFAHLPAHYHLVMGGFAFGCVFMATDPVSAASTNLGKCMYGFALGILVIVIRVANPAYPEGVMLAILFMNVMSPLIDHYIVAAHIKRRVKHA